MLIFADKWNKNYYTKYYRSSTIWKLKIPNRNKKLNKLETDKQKNKSNNFQLTLNMERRICPGGE